MMAMRGKKTRRAYKEKEMADEKNLYNPHDGLTGRDGGPYLDQEERRLAEIVRAAKEDREPDFENAPATAGTPLVDAATLIAMANPASNPSQSAKADAVLPSAVEVVAASDDFAVTAHSTRALTDEEKEAKRLAESNNPHDNPANPTVVSSDEDTAESVKDTLKQNESDFGSPDKAPAKKTAAAKSTSK
jgi:hypothetical protein